MAVQIIDNRKAENTIKFVGLPVGQFFITTEGKLAQKVIETTSENNVVVYNENGVAMSRMYKDDPIMPVDIQLVITKETELEQKPAAEQSGEEQDAPTPQQVEDQPGVNVVSIKQDK